MKKISLLLLVFSFALLAKAEKEHSFKPSKAKFSWKALWVQQLCEKDDIDRVITLASELGINAIAFRIVTHDETCFFKSKYMICHSRLKINPLKELVEQAHKNSMKVYAWAFNLTKSHEDLSTCETPAPLPDGIDRTVHHFDWFSPDRGVIEIQKLMATELLRDYGVDGFAFDFIDYAEYYSRYSVSDIHAKVAFAEEHPDLTKSERKKLFPQISLAKWLNQFADQLGRVKSFETLVLIYPKYTPGDKVRSVIWGEPLLYDHVKEDNYTLKKCLNDEFKDHKIKDFVPFVEVLGCKRYPKTPEELRREIRLAGAVGKGKIMIGFYRDILSSKEHLRVLREELK